MYSLYNSWPVKLVRNLAISIILILPFFEFPNSISATSDPRFKHHYFRMPEPRCGTTEAVEIVCLFIFLIDWIIRFRLIGFRRFLQQKWLVVYAILVIVSFADLFLSVSFCFACGQSSLAATLRLRRFFRPLFFVVPSSIMKKFIKAVGRTIQNILGVFVLLILHIYVFAMIGMLIFPEAIPTFENNTSNGTDDSWDDRLNLTNSTPDFAHLEGTKYFNSVEDSLVSLLVFLTTANNPDVMTPVYQGSRVSFIYFFLFLSIGLYLILNLFTAAIYSGFRGYIEQSMQSSFLRRRVAFRAAFAILVRSTRTSRHCANKNLVRQVLQKAKIPKRQLPAMHTLLETINIDVEELNWENFKEIFDLISKPTATRSNEEIEYYSRFKVMELMQRIVRNSFFQYFSIGMSLLHVGLLTYEMEKDYRDTVRHSNSPLAYANFFFSFYYLLEQTTKIVGLGKRRYFLSFANLFEGVVTFCILLTELVIIFKFGFPFHPRFHNYEPSSYNTFIQLMNLFIVFRLLRLISQFRSVSIAFGSMVEILKNLRAFAGIIIVIYYLFALLGIAIFSEKYEPKWDGNTKSHASNSYENLDYYAYNFYDFASALVLLWNIMVVNNWYVFLDAFSRATGTKWAQLYFICWWLISVIITLNLFISLVIEVFLTRWEAYQGRKDRDRADEREIRVNRNQINSSGFGSLLGQSFDSQASVPSTISDVRVILSKNLTEPPESVLDHEIHRHRELV